jgi:hypothetical protein
LRQAIPFASSTPLLCYLFLDTPLAEIYYFAPVPWHVYLFAFHGTALLLAFEETKKHFRRKGYALEILDQSAQRELLDHRKPTTTMLYTHFFQAANSSGVWRPANC